MAASRALRAALVGASVGAVVAKPTLKVKDDGTFRIALFCDMHYGENAAKDVSSGRFQEQLLSLEKPDLVVIDGDASSNYAAPFWCRYVQQNCTGWFDARWKDFTAPLEASRTPYAYTLGNHDRIPGNAPVGGIETNYSVPDHYIMQKDETNPYSLAHDGPSSIHGASNYVLPVLGADGKPAAYVWLMDSTDNNCMGTTGWGCVYPDQVEWYRNTSKQLIEQDGRVVPGVMFHHIPLDEVNSAWNDPSVEVVGSKGEDVCCFSVNTGLFAALKEVGNIWGVFHGHDHNDDFVASYQGLKIGYGRKSGYGGYGGVVADKRGSRIFEISFTSDGSAKFDTWIREEAGSKVVQAPAVDRPSGPNACCGTTAYARDSVLIEMDDTMSCRVHDDVEACRRATSSEDSGSSVLFA